MHRRNCELRPAFADLVNFYVGRVLQPGKKKIICTMRNHTCLAGTCKFPAKEQVKFEFKKRRKIPRAKRNEGSLCSSIYPQDEEHWPKVGIHLEHQNVLHSVHRMYSLLRWTISRIPPLRTISWTRPRSALPPPLPRSSPPRFLLFRLLHQ